MMESTVYLFSKFSTEFLLLETLAICVLVAGYSAFYVLRKRRLGHVDQTVPSGVVKTYLSHLILEAEQMRAQLFGLLGGNPAQFAAGVSAVGLGTGVDTQALLAALQAQNANAGAAAPGAAAGDPNLVAKVQLLEGKMNEQTKAMHSMVSEKEKIEKELTTLRASSGAGATAGNGNPSEVSELQDKLKTLEGKLAEYSIIEDDLANLKRLQQENAQLRAALANQGGSLPESTAATPPPEAEALSVTEEKIKLPEAPEIVEPLAALPVAEPGNFEGLVDQVEQSLQAAPAVAVTLAVSQSAQEKTDADLVEEFEKMLNA